MTKRPQDEAGLRAALAADPRNAKAHAALGQLLLARAETAPTQNATLIAEAVKHLRDAINDGVREANIVKSFVRALGAVDKIPADWRVVEALLNAINAGRADLFDSIRAMLAVFAGMDDGRTVFDRAATAAMEGDDQNFESTMDSAQAREIFGHPLLSALLRGGMYTATYMDFLLRAARRYFLRRALDGGSVSIHPSERAFCYAAADQCFLTEYAYWENAEETMWCDVLAENFA
ncbi:MAG: hypothetical protein RLN70_04045, partial [Rhodospirillaceae bacterium]